MSFIETCVRRPVFATVLTLIVVAIGIVLGLRVSIRQLPKVDIPIVSVQVDMPGASPQVIESQLTRPLEDALSKIDGIDVMHSTSSPGSCKVHMEFKLNQNIEIASGDVRDAISRIRADLPREGITEPIIKKVGNKAEAVMYVGMWSNSRSLTEVMDYAERYIKNKFEVIPGVATVELYGAGKYQMDIRLDPLKMGAYNVTVDEIKHALGQQNVEMAGGNIRSKDKQYMISTLSTLEKKEDFENVVVGNYKGFPVKIKDIAYVEIDAPEKDHESLYNGKKIINFSIFRQSVANPMDIAREVKNILPTISLPSDMKMEVTYDTTVFIGESLKDVYHTLFEAIVLVVLVVLMFLLSVRASIIPLVAIPVSLIGALILIYIMDFTINTLTLLAMVLAIGLVVDDAIVILENIYVKIEKGMKPFRASIEGAREISFAVLAMTLTLVAVYAPISLVSGEVGNAFREFALTLAGAVLFSGFVALTLSPMMCSLILKPHNTHSKIQIMHSKFLNAIDVLYEKILIKALNMRLIMSLIGIMIGSLGYYLASYYLPHEFAPPEDRGMLRIESQPVHGATLEFARRYSNQIDKILSSVPEVQGRFIYIDLPKVTAYGILKDWKTRGKSSKRIADEIEEKINSIPGLTLSIEAEDSPFGEGNSMVVRFNLLSAKSIDYISTAGHRMLISLNNIPGVDRVMTVAPPDAQDFAVEIDRSRATDLGIDVKNIAEAINILSGKLSSHFFRAGKRYEVRLDLPEDIKNNPDILKTFFLKRTFNTSKNDEDKMIPLSDLVTIVQRNAQATISHVDKLRSLQAYVYLKKGANLGAIVRAAQEAQSMLPEDVSLAFSGETKTFIKESGNIYMIFGMALIFIFLIMAAQFESFIDPLIIMTSVPLSMTGALLMLAFVDKGSLNIFSQIGLVTLIGLITKHGILIVEFANQLQLEGHDKISAVVSAAKQRLRPILMTTFAMVLGALPLALATGAGAETRRQIGWVIVGGLSFGTLCTLFIVPAIYTYWTRKHIAYKKHLNRE